MKGKKCGLLLVLFIIFGLSLGVSLDVKALKHSYTGISIASWYLPTTIYDSSSGKYVFDFSNYDHDNNKFLSSRGFGLGVQGSLWNDYYSSSFVDYEDLFDDFSYSYSQVKCDLSGSLDNCVFDTYPDTMFGGSSRQDVSGGEVSLSASFIPAEFQEYFVRGVNMNYYNYFSKDVYSQYSNGYAFASYLECSIFYNGVSCPGIWNLNDFVDTQVKPFTYTSAGFYRSNSAVDTNSGITYSYTFSPSDLFGNKITSISQLYIPFGTTDDYYLNSENLFEGRQFEYKGVFDFDEDFSLSSIVNTFNLSVNYISADTGENEYFTTPCRVNKVVVEFDDLYQLEYSCSFQLPENMLAMSPYLEIMGGSQSCSSNSCYQSVWTTNGSWRFGSMFVVTDNDETSGYNFNEDIGEYGGGVVLGSDQDIINNHSNSDNADFFESLKNLFGFIFVNPFAPLFNLFSDNNSCAQIPTLASMLHSQETQVCPWFDSTTRNIVTPVLGISSMMLVFGFAVRWLGARSGNFVEDSGGIDSGGYHFENKFKRRK